MDRGRRGALALVATVLWLGYMAVGLRLIDVILPTRAGQGPEGTAAFIGLVGGIVWAGVVMWAASE